MRTTSHPHIAVPRPLLAVDINGYSEDAHCAKQAFHAEGKRFLKKVADALGLEKDSYDVRSNQGGMAVSGEVTLHSDTLYVQLYESATSRGVSVLYRSCASRKDYSGGQNHFIQADALRDPGRQAGWLQSLEALRHRVTAH